MKLSHITGMSKVLTNLASADAKIVRALHVGMYRAGLYLQKESQKIVPVDLGNLKASAFTRKVGVNRNIDVVVGYTASYAAYVHEDLTKAHGQEYNLKHQHEITKWDKGVKRGRNLLGQFTKTSKSKRKRWHLRGENQQAKFLERPAREKRLVIFKMIADSDKFVV